MEIDKALIPILSDDAVGTMIMSRVINEDVLKVDIRKAGRGGKRGSATDQGGGQPALLYHHTDHYGALLKTHVH